MTERPTNDSQDNDAPLSRRRWLGRVAVGGAALAGLDACLVEPRLLPVTTHVVGAADLPPTRIVQLSDLHLRGSMRRAERIAQLVAEHRPALITITGDAIDDARNLGLLESFLDMLDARVSKVAILGNWEYWGRVDFGALRSAYAKRGCDLLINESRVLEFGDRRLLTIGLDDFVAGQPNLKSAHSDSLTVPNALLLGHCPALRDLPGLQLARNRAPNALMLSGHTHAGQFAPFGWAPLRPYGSGRYVAGWYRDDGLWPLYVSRGIGTSIAPVRLFAPPEIAVFDVSLRPG